MEWFTVILHKENCASCCKFFFAELNLLVCFSCFWFYALYNLQFFILIFNLWYFSGTYLLGILGGNNFTKSVKAKCLFFTKTEFITFRENNQNLRFVLLCFLCFSKLLHCFLVCFIHFSKNKVFCSGCFHSFLQRYFLLFSIVRSFYQG